MADQTHKEENTLADSFQQTVAAFENLAPAKQREVRKIIAKIRSRKESVESFEKQAVGA